MQDGGRKLGQARIGHGATEWTSVTKGRAVIMMELRSPALEMVGMLPSAVGSPESFLRRLHAVFSLHES